MDTATIISLDELAAAEARNTALAYMSEAFAEAALDGVDVDACAEAAFSAAFRELIAAYGEDRAIKIAQSLPARVRAGEFSILTRQ